MRQRFNLLLRILVLLAMPTGMSMLFAKLVFGADISWGLCSAPFATAYAIIFAVLLKPILYDVEIFKKDCEEQYTK